MLHKKFVVLMDKASDKVAFVFQRYYAQVAINRVGPNNVNPLSANSSKWSNTLKQFVTNIFVHKRN